MGKSIIIIGAGIAGLSAGCYGRMNGYGTRIFEMDAKPGGVCTSWKRKGYTIDGCLHWLVGSSPASSYYRIWEELGIPQNLTFINHEEYTRIEGESNKALVLYSDPARLERHMRELAPEDTKPIDDFLGGIEQCTRIQFPVDKAPELYGPIDKVKGILGIAPHLGFFRKWGKVTVHDFASRFKDCFMREAFSVMVQDVPDFPMLGLLFPLAWVRQKTAGYPLGGSLPFARTIERRYLDLGGEVTYKARVEKVLVRDGKAIGIRLSDGTEHFADIVISAADGHTTIFDMLEGKYMDGKIRQYYTDLPLFPPLVHAAFGVARTFPEIPTSVGGTQILLETPLNISGKMRTRLNLYIYNQDPSLAPEGKTVVKFMINSDFDYWDRLYKAPDRYRAEKERLADDLVSVLEQRFPGISRQVEVRDVATPMTWVRYTGNWRGSYEGWMVREDTFNLRMSKTLPGLDDFYMAGQWVEPGGGLPPAAVSGRNIIQILCKRDRTRFVAGKP